MTDSSLEETALHIFEELGASLNPSDIEAYHCVGSNSLKKVSSRTPDGKMQRELRYVKKPLKSVKLELLKVDNSIFINDSLCSYYKRLWSKCMKLWTNKYIHSF